MPMRPAHLQALYARRREIEHNRIERTEAANKYFDHWGKVTARFENWTTPEYYQQAEKKLQDSRDKKEKLKRLQERQQKLAQLLAKEKKMFEDESHAKEKNPRNGVDTEMLEKVNKDLKEEEKMRRQLELEAKLYGKWRHGVEDDNLLFESKTDNETLAKLNWLDRKVHQQMQKELDHEKAKERDIKLHEELNKTEELQKERHRIREKEIREIRCLQEYHMEQLKVLQLDTDAMKEKEKKLKSNLEDLEKESELLEESFKVLDQKADLNGAYNLNKIKILIRQRSEVFRNQIKLCLSIVERTLEFAEKPELLKILKKRLETELEKEDHKLSQIESMYESEARSSLRRNEDHWHTEHSNRYKIIKEAIMEEHQLIKAKLDDVMKKHQELLELKSTHLGVIENSSEKLKHLIQEDEHLAHHQKHQANRNSMHDRHVEFDAGNYEHTGESEYTHSYSPRQLSPEPPHEMVDFETRRNLQDSNNSNLSPRCYDSHDCNDIDQASNSFNHLNLDAYHGHGIHPSRREVEEDKTNAQRTMQVVTDETEADRPRFGRKNFAWN